MAPNILEKLVVNEDELSGSVAQTLYEMLNGFVKVGNKGNVILESAFETLDSERKVFVVIAAATVASLLKLSSQDGLHPKQVEQITLVPGGTIRPRLKLLLERRLVVTQEDGCYTFPISAISRAKDYLQQKKSQG